MEASLFVAEELWREKSAQRHVKRGGTERDCHVPSSRGRASGFPLGTRPAGLFLESSGATRGEKKSFGNVERKQGDNPPQVNVTLTIFNVESGRRLGAWYT